MDLDELTSLISIRDYVAITINSSAIDRPTVNELSGMLILIDRKILNVLKDKGFKDYIGFANAKQAIAEVAEMNNIKHGMKK